MAMFLENKLGKYLLIACLWGSASCALGEFQFNSLLSEQPHVVAVEPELDQAIEATPEFKIIFSERIDFSKVTPESVALLSKVKDVKVLQDVDELQDGIRDSSFGGLTLQYLLSSDETELTILLDAPLTDGEYHLVVTPLLSSAKGVPFNQKPGESPTPFVASFHHGQPQATGETGGSNSNLPGETFGPTPEKLVIHEFLYDGLTSETDGEAFVELLGTPGSDISLFQVQFINGADGEETERVTLPPGSLIGPDGIFVIADLKTGATSSRIDTADFLDHFDPQNGPDGILLLNRDGELVDSVMYGEGALDTAKNGMPLGEGSPALDVIGGHSLSRTQGSDTQDNKLDFIDLEIPTPGTL